MYNEVYLTDPFTLQMIPKTSVHVASCVSQEAHNTHLNLK